MAACQGKCDRTTMDPGHHSCLIVKFQGIQVETPQERKAKAIAAIMKESDSMPLTEVTYVCVPADISQPLQERVFQPTRLGDALLAHLQSTLVSALATDDATSNKPAVGLADAFPLAHALAANDFIGVNLYFDPTGRLKGLPLNTRAMEYAQWAGYNPPPEFFGTVALGRIRNENGVTENVSFSLGMDTDLEMAEWLQHAAEDNLEHQIRPMGCRADDPPTGTIGRDQPAGYTWTQTEEEIEITVDLPSNVSSKDIQVTFKPRHLWITLRKEALLEVALFEAVDVEGSTWALDPGKLVVTLEKVEQALWARIQE